MARILVTAATGRVGSALVPQLVAEGHVVRAVTRRAAAAAALSDSGADPIVADIRQPETLGTAIEGVDAIFLATADDPQQHRIEQALIAMIAATGRPHVVKLSAQSAGLSPPVSFGALHRQAEDALRASGLPFTILRPTFFQQSVLLFADDIASKNRIIAPAGQGKIAMVNIEDVARAAAAVIAGGDHLGKIYELTGPTASGFDDIAALLSRQLGRPIGYVSPPALLARIVLPFMTDMPRWQSNLFVDLLSALRGGAQQTVSPDIEGITGRPAISLETFLTANLASFRA